MRKILPIAFFDRPTLAVARGLLGKYLVRRRGRNVEAAMIVEVEAYDGFRDRASHAHRGETARNAPMFGRAGRWYVYFVYGRHWMLNIVTGAKGYPAAVLIRAAGDWRGPARLTKAFGVNGKLNGKAATKRTGLWIEDRGAVVPAVRVRRAARIGVDYAGDWAGKKYRFFIENPLPKSLPSRNGLWPRSLKNL